MLRLPRFTYESPADVASAVAMLDGYGSDARVVSGGTDLLVNMKQRLATPRVLIGLRSVRDMQGITYDERNGLHIGAMTTLHALATSRVVAQHYPALAVAASLISTPELRRMGTVGGNVCLDTRCYYYNQDAAWRSALGYCLKKDGDVCRVAIRSERCLAINSSDLAPVLQAFGARAHITGTQGERVTALERMYSHDGRFAHTLGAAEIVTAITIPPEMPRTRSTYRKLRNRESFDFPLAGIAAVVNLDEAGTCCDARIVAGALGPQPLECTDARDVLVGTKLEEDALREAAERVYAVGKPMENAAASPFYRKRMLRVFAYRALLELRTAGRQPIVTTAFSTGSERPAP